MSVARISSRSSATGFCNRRWSERPAVNAPLQPEPGTRGRIVVRALRLSGSDSWQPAGRPCWNASVRVVVLAPEPGCLGMRVCGMSQQACLDCAQRRQCLPRRVCHGETGTALKVMPHRLICRIPTQTLPLLHPPGCGRDRLVSSDAHVAMGCKKDANVARQWGRGATAMPAESSRPATKFAPSG